jgi:hypothetical protein
LFTLAILTSFDECKRLRLSRAKIAFVAVVRWKKVMIFREEEEWEETEDEEWEEEEW